MKAMVLVLSPKECRDLLNGDLSILIRKKFPKDYIGWVYVYCTKGKVYMRPYLVKENDFNDHMTMLYDKDFVPKPKEFELYDFRDGGFSAQFFDFYDGKVVARFWCDRVENLYEYQIDGYGSDYEIASDTLKQEELLKECCLTYEQLNDYLGDINNGKAIHITKLKIFDKSKEIKEFDAYCEGGMKCLHCKHYWTDDSAGYSIDKCGGKPLTRAPRSGWCYVEGL